MSNRASIWNKTVIGWSLYDFANSAFATTILAVIFNKYYAQVVAGGEEGTVVFGYRVQGAALFGYVLSLSYAVIAVASPVLGAIADAAYRRKSFLGVCCAVGVSASGLLYYVGPGDVFTGSMLFIIANMGFAGGNVFYNSFLPEISNESNAGRISGLGWAVGYVGGGMLLGVNLVMLQYPELLGFAPGTFTVGHCFVSVALWWGLFSIPMFVWVPEQGRRGTARDPSGYVRSGFRRVGETLRHIRRYREFSKFILSYLMFNDGIETVIVFASIYGATVVGMDTGELIVFFLVIQGTAFAGSLLLGFLSDAWGQKRTLLAALCVWTLIVLWASVLGMWDLKGEYWILGILTGIVLGGSQSIARSLAGLLIPPSKSAEFYGFYAISGKFAAVLGPAMYSSAIALTGSMTRGILVLGLLFVSGMIGLATVNVPAGILAARAETP